jgi:predicted aconitase
MVVSPIEGLFRSTATNSAKAAHYLVKDGYGNQKVRYGTLEEVLALLY